LLYALFKITITGNGVGCEIVGKSNDVVEEGKFSKFVISNALEIIAYKVA